ncbi:histidinol-phosphate aminotransferase [filamentous cyanobacterium CCP5]|nr:histidinol-phosphate aminotransferase [filamentous cyanobacterium CCP5]
MPLPYLRPELVALAAYSSHGGDDQPLPAAIDHLDTNEYPEDLPSALKEKLGWIYQQEIAANRYPDGSHAQLRAAIATYVNESGTQATAANISVGNGSDELIRSLLIATCLGGHGAAMVATPTFSMYRILAETLGIPVVSVPRDPDTFALDPGVAQSALHQSQPVRVVFMVHPNSPTANPLTPAELDWLQQLPENILVVVDEAYFEFCHHTTVAIALERPNWVVLRTFSKAFRLAAHRVGYGVAHADLIAVLEKVRLPYNLPSLTQAVAHLALSHRQELLAPIPQLLAERDRLQREIAPLLRVWPSAANFIYGRPRSNLDIQDQELHQIFQRLREQGTLIRHTGGGLRITIGTPKENQRTLERLKQAV